MTTKNYPKRINFGLFCIILFFGITALMVIPDFQSLEKRGSNESYFEGKAIHDRLINYRPDFWKISPGDGKISNFENIIIALLTIWGIMRLIDILGLFVDWDKEKNLACFFNRLD